VSRFPSKSRSLGVGIRSRQCLHDETEVMGRGHPSS
jgi:hypothetical protein